MSERRKANMDRIVKMLSGSSPPVIEGKFMSLCAYNLGLSTRTVREYLKVLVDIGSVTREGEFLIWHE